MLGSVGMEGTELRINKKPVLTIKGQHRLVDHFLTKWTCVRISFLRRPFCRRQNLRRCRTSRISFLWWNCGWYHRTRNYRSERRWVRGIRLGRLGSVVCISLNRYYFVLDRCQMMGRLTYDPSLRKGSYKAFIGRKISDLRPHVCCCAGRV